MSTIRFILFMTGLLAWLSLAGQTGKITYKRTENFQQITANLPCLSQEEKDRITATGSSRYSAKDDIWHLYFQKEKSLYLVNASRQDKYRDKDIFSRDFENSKVEDKRELPDASYIVEDSLTIYSWKILNEFKDVAGYVCMKAETQDTVNDVTVHAWFTDKIPYFTGPEGYHGLPGLILLLEWNEGDVVVEATKVEWLPEGSEFVGLKKIKGKKITSEAFNQLKKQFIRSRLSRKENPYWWVRY